MSFFDEQIRPKSLRKKGFVLGRSSVNPAMNHISGILSCKLPVKGLSTMLYR